MPVRIQAISCTGTVPTWGDRNMYGLVIIYANAAIFHVTKKLGLVAHY